MKRYFFLILAVIYFLRCNAADSVSIIVNSPSVGAIRWDAWVGKNGTWQIGPIVERTLGPQKFHYRAPFFSIVKSPDSLIIDGATQEIMDQEIIYARNAGIDYWAYCWYPDGCGLELARKFHQTSFYANDVNWCVILQGFEENISGPAGITLVSDFALENYQKVLDGRPLVYLYSSDITKTGLGKLRTMSMEKTGKEPYVVVMDWSAESASSYCRSIGADAISSYAELGSNNLPFRQIIPPKSISNWESYANLEAIVPWVCTGWNAKPRMESENPWSAYYSDATNCQDASPSDLKEFLSSALQWTIKNREKAEANTLIMYAWNEHDEGYGSICPTLGTDQNPDTSRLTAVKEALNNREKDTIKVPCFNVLINLLDSQSSQPITGATVIINDSSKTTDLTGKVSFGQITSPFRIKTLDPHYELIKYENYSISSDTIITLHLVWKGYTVRFTIKDNLSVTPIRGAKIQFGDQSQVTDPDGSAEFTFKGAGTDFTINKLLYRSETGILDIYSDTTIIISLVRIAIEVKFRLKDGSAPLNEARVIIGSDTLVSNTIGTVVYKSLIPCLSYLYFIQRDGYIPVSGEFNTCNDTVIDLNLQKDISGTIRKPSPDDLKVIQDPLTRTITVATSPGLIRYPFRISDLTGSIVYNGRISGPEMQIDLGRLVPGLYFLSVYVPGHNLCQRFVLK